MQDYRREELCVLECLGVTQVEHIVSDIADAERANDFVRPVGGYFGIFEGDVQLECLDFR